MASKRLNVLVYSGPGATQNALRHTLFTLRRLLTPSYAVLPLSSTALLSEPWQPTCALLVFPGGADAFYCTTLNGPGNRLIRTFVERGGSYLGLCAGGYYGSSRCEFEPGNPALEVLGDRELGFFPGICRGAAFGGFRYETEDGARAAEVRVETGRLEGRVPGGLRVYYNGGGVFVGADGLRGRGVEVLARFVEVGELRGELGEWEGEGPAAVVWCRVGEGAALLMSPHPEFSAPNLEVLHWKAERGDWEKTMEKIKRDEQLRSDFMRGCLKKLGLNVSENGDTPSLSKLYLSSRQSEGVDRLMDALGEIITTESGRELIKDDNDTFSLERPGDFSMNGLKAALPDTTTKTASPDNPTNSSTDKRTFQSDNTTARTPPDQITDFNTIIKPISVHRTTHPTSKETPYFNHAAYFSHLTHYQSLTPSANPLFGANLLYGEVVTSTQTLLEKNTKLLRALPDGFTFNATTQVAGRGRGSNVWISPAGTLLFSILLRHEVALQQRAPVVFIQYLAAMAVVDAVRTYDRGYQNIDVRLKWPNDIYALDPKAPANASFQNRFTKIGGILVNSHYSSTTYHCVMGLGLNVSNALPTTSLNGLLADRYPHLEPFSQEKLLARIIVSFSALYARFRRTGFDLGLEERYYEAWLHTGQIVSLEMEAGKRARIVGITSDWGLLVAEEVDEEGRGFGRKIELQSDSNSFDFFKGLVRRKI